MPNGDFDGDSVQDFRDVDSDNDGLPDLSEADGFASDADTDGRIDGFVDLNGDGLDDGVAAVPFDIDDIDEDGFPDHLDLDTDNDGIFDLQEAGGVDSNNDGLVDGFADTNQNGIPDTADAALIGGSDADNDGIIDIADADFVTDEDTNGNGIVDAFEDGNGDGFIPLTFSDGSQGNLVDQLPDTNANGIPDVDEPDAEALIDGTIKTGLEGRAGCSINSGSSKDPTFMVLMLAAMGIFLRRRATLAPAKRA